MEDVVYSNLWGDTISAIQLTLNYHACTGSAFPVECSDGNCVAALNDCAEGRDGIASGGVSGVVSGVASGGDGTIPPTNSTATPVLRRILVRDMVLETRGSNGGKRREEMKERWRRQEKG